MPESTSIVVIGGGLIGLSTARALLLADRSRRVIVLEKEAAPGQHQSTHNSGVLHAGLYYKPGSLKADFAVRGIRAMTAFCREHGVPHEICGKLVVAADDSEVPRLRTLLERGTANGLVGLRWLGPTEAAELEPNVRCVAAVHVPEEGIVDYRRVVQALAMEIVHMGGTVQTSAGVRRIEADASGWRIDTDANEFRARAFINCAGLHSDRIARLAGEQTDCRIVPFRGEYFLIRPPNAGRSCETLSIRFLIRSSRFWESTSRVPSTANSRPARTQYWRSAARATAGVTSRFVISAKRLRSRGSAGSPFAIPGKPSPRSAAR
jgi:L-2-hydroxyglutarate oxidase